MDQIADHTKSVLRPTQTPTPAKVQGLRKQPKSEDSQRKDLQTNYEKLVRKYDLQKKEVQYLNTQLQDSIQETDRLRILLHGGSFANPNKLADDEFRTEWSKMAYNIRCLVHILDGTWAEQPLDDGVTHRLRRVSKDYRSHFQDPNFRASLMQGYLWILIRDIVFNTKQEIWGGPGVGMLKATKDSLIAHIGEMEGKLETEPSVALIAGWLYRGYPVIGKLYGNDSIDVKHVVDVETKRLRPFMADRQSKNDRIDGMVSDQLKDILDSAIKLDQMMMSSRAIFQVCWGDRPQEPGNLARWNPDVMEAKSWKREPSPKSRVLFHISPILYKIGSADGLGYDSHKVLAKGKVVCD